jgi:hypothetical protein
MWSAVMRRYLSLVACGAIISTSSVALALTKAECVACIKKTNDCLNAEGARTLPLARKGVADLDALAAALARCMVDYNVARGLRHLCHMVTPG